MSQIIHIVPFAEATCSNQQPTDFTLQELLAIASKMPKVTVPRDCFCGKGAYEWIRQHPRIVLTAAATPEAGIEFWIDANLPVNVVEFRWRDGRVEKRLELFALFDDRDFNERFAELNRREWKQELIANPESWKPTPPAPDNSEATPQK